MLTLCCGGSLCSVVCADAQHLPRGVRRGAAGVLTCTYAIPFGPQPCLADESEASSTHTYSEVSQDQVEQLKNLDQLFRSAGRERQRRVEHAFFSASLFLGTP